MCARCFSSRRTNPFSAMICNIFSTVVYCVGLRAQTHSCTWRTVADPRLQSTVRISNSASVGRGSISAIYEKLTTKTFVCQAQTQWHKAPPCASERSSDGQAEACPTHAAQPPGNGQRSELRSDGQAGGLSHSLLQFHLHVPQGPDRQSRRDRRPRHPHAPRNGHR